MLKITFLSLLIIITATLIPQQLPSQSINTYGHADNVVLLNQTPEFVGTSSGRFHLSFDSLYPQIDTIIIDSFRNATGHISHYGSKPAVYSDKNGKLQLYAIHTRDSLSPVPHFSTGVSVVVRNGSHQVIDTLGKKLSGLGSSYGYFWPLIAVPMPGNPDYVYLFMKTRYPTSQYNYPHNPPMKLHWSLIDLSANNGQGGVIFDTQVFSTDSMHPASWALTKHANGRDYWLVSKKYASREYVTYHIQPQGAVDTVRSEAGREWIYDMNHVATIFKFSPDGRWLADNNPLIDTTQLLNFDASTGIISDSNIRYVPPRSPLDGFGVARYVAFSPDSRFVYAYQPYYDTRVYQYDLSTPNQQFFFDLRVVIHNHSGWVPSHDHRRLVYLFTAANGKIYSRTHAPWPGWGYGLNSIESPNSSGMASQARDTSFLLSSAYGQGSTPEMIRFPQFASSWLKEPLDFSYSHVCAGEGTPPTHFAFTDSVVDAFWSFGDTLAMGADTSNLFFPSYNYNHPGDYHVWAKALSYGMWDSISKVITIHPPAQVALGPDTVLTGNDSLVLDAGPDHISYNWSTGDSTRTITLYGTQLSPGYYMYHVEVTDTNGCTGTGSIMVTYEEDTTSIVQKARKPLWEVFPNPCEDNLHIQFPQSMASGQANLRLYSPEGKLLQKWDIPAHTHRFTVDMSAYSSAIYWLELSTGDKVRREKIVKVNHP